MRLFYLLFILLLSLASGSRAASPLAIQRLRCDSRDAPLGVEGPQPHLSWQLVSKQRGQRRPTKSG